LDIARRFGANLNAARRASGLTLERLAAKAGLHRTAIGLLESGRRVPRVDTVVHLARALGIGPGELMIGLASAPEQMTLKAAPLGTAPGLPPRQTPAE
jgi:transcriptional regulator with XRE-family HTH domain